VAAVRKKDMKAVKGMEGMKKGPHQTTALLHDLHVLQDLHVIIPLIFPLEAL